ncbi:MFS domain-containing protein [Fusarium keratoplasticum]|uniref:MFS domain-containing protein n=1 Tax=Fusarium keratoplasticum TaxID=1328300 RepID=A0ACC0QQ83_9HYPO|nr:MFS domain-containing protein [Fusarium keratoplasticum]KAI8663235.1 MFS domain-containing protein [Fusarium keratoplasticum]KAI8663928.1 MFS domain-containing protein [Fusarium keratoplasticum]
MGTAFWPSYQSYYFELTGATSAQAMNYGCTSVAIGTSIITYMLIENVGRRRLWLFGATGMACSNLIGGFMYIPFVNGNAQVAGKVATAMVFLWNGFYDIGPTNMGYAITSEVPSNRMIVHVGSHLTGFALSYAVPYMYNPDAGNLGLRMGFIWGGFSVIFVIWGFFFIPDVTGLNFYQIDQLFESRAPVRKFHQAKFDYNGLLIRSFSTRTSEEAN